MVSLSEYRRSKQLDELAALMRAGASVPLEIDMAETPKTIRLADDDLERAKALIPALEAMAKREPMLGAAGRVTLSYVLRLAVLRGLAALEAEHDAA